MWNGRLHETDFSELAEDPVIGPLFRDPVYADCFNSLRLAMELAQRVNLVSPNNREEVQKPDNPDAYRDELYRMDERGPSDVWGRRDSLVEQILAFRPEDSGNG